MTLHLLPLLAALSLAMPAAGGQLGTRVRWEPTPAQAFTRAAREGKLVLLMHLSGNFDRRDKT